jgi:hypothetical protein
VLQPDELAVETTRLVAAKSPDELVLPCAETHLFTTSAAEVAASDLVYLVAEVTAIFFVLAAPLCEVADTVMDVAETAVTLPDTGWVNPPVPLVGAPLGRVPVAPPDPVGAPLGRVPVGPPVPPAPPPKPVAQVPDDVAAVIAIVPEPNEETHEPTVTADDVAATVAVILVELV